MSTESDFRKFQQELASLGRTEKAERAPASMSKKEHSEYRLARLKEEFMAFQEHYGLSLAEIVAFFPEGEGVEYLESLIEASDSKGHAPRRLKRA